MKMLLPYLCLLLVAVTPFTVMLVSAESSSEDSLDSEDPIPTEEPSIDEDIEFDENGVPKLKPSPDADIFFKFTKPDGLTLELPAGQEVQFLVGFKNKGNQDYVVESLEASFRYPQDFNYHIQNFTAAQYNRLVKPTQEATFAYSLLVNDALAERPFGFIVSLLYKDASGKHFSSAAFNQTVNIVELDDGLNLQTLFIYLFLASLAFGILFTVYSFLSSKLHFGKSGKKKKVETGTANANAKIDYDWIPDQINSKTSPKATPKTKKAKKDN